METIVVGLDGSEGSVEALRWAANEAALREAKLRAVTVWEYSYAYGGIEPAFVIPPQTLEEEARATLEAAIAAGIPDPKVAESVERVVTSGSPSKAMIEESEHAALLVVGARGHGGFMGLLLGSTSDQVVKHAACPVVVVRNPTSP